MSLRPPTTPVVHLELHTSELEAARTFYAALCHWRPERVPTGSGAYQAMSWGGSVGGGIVDCPVPRPLWLPYVEVPNVEAMTERACELGAAVAVGPREGPVGWRSVITTPAGGALALWQPKR